MFTKAIDIILSILSVTWLITGVFALLAIFFNTTIAGILALVAGGSLILFYVIFFTALYFEKRNEKKGLK